MNYRDDTSLEFGMHAWDGSDIIETDCLKALADASNDVRRVRRMLATFTGKRVRVRCVRDYTLDFCTPDEIILVQDDLDAWRRVPCMEGRLYVVGVLGANDMLCWDKPVVGMSRTGKLFTLHLGRRSYVIRLCDSFRELYEYGVNHDYLRSVDIVNCNNFAFRRHSDDYDDSSGTDGTRADSAHADADDESAEPFSYECRIVQVNLGDLNPEGSAQWHVSDKLMDAAKREMQKLNKIRYDNY